MASPRLYALLALGTFLIIGTMRLYKDPQQAEKLLELAKANSEVVVAGTAIFGGVMHHVYTTYYAEPPHTTPPDSLYHKVLTALTARSSLPTSAEVCDYILSGFIALDTEGASKITTATSAPLTMDTLITYSSA